MRQVLVGVWYVSMEGVVFFFAVILYIEQYLALNPIKSRGDPSLSRLKTLRDKVVGPCLQNCPK